MALSALPAGCADPFPPETLVERLRILAVKAEPSEVDIDQTVELSALVADPNGAGRSLVFTWAVCLFDFSDAASDIPCPGPDSYPIAGDGPQRALSMPELIAWLIEQGYQPDLGSGPGPDALASEIPPLLVGLRVEVGSESIRGIKRIALRRNDDEPANTNPVLTGLELDGEPLDAGPHTLSAGGSHELRPLVAEGSQEWYLPEGEDQRRQEDHLFSWFSTCGELADQRTILDVDRLGNPLQNNEWQLPDEGGSCSLWLVVRDGRFGVDWRAYRFEIDGSPAG